MIYIQQVIETTDSKEVNEFLRQGWRLLALIPGDSVSEGPYFLYCLGLPREKEIKTNR